MDKEGQGRALSIWHHFTSTYTISIVISFSSFVSPDKPLLLLFSSFSFFPSSSPSSLQGILLFSPPFSLFLVLLLIDRFNYVSGWVATTICLTEKLQDRARVVRKFIEIALVY